MNEGMGRLWQRIAEINRVSEAKMLCDALSIELRFGAPVGSERADRLHRLVRMAEDRISRREYRYRCVRDGQTVVTTAQVARWVRTNITRYMGGLDGVDPAEIAGDACNALGLWDSIGSIPAWVWGLCERVAPRAAQEVMRRRAFFVEKPIRYEADGDCIWA